jgi:hypothetical protein
MKISKRSWHYRLLRWIQPEELKSKGLSHKNLCSYVSELFFLILFGFPLMGLVLVLFGPFILLADWMERNSKNKKSEEEPKEPRTLLGKWLKAKKDKVCPMIEWVDE